jgi:anhydro-N-acetylmuramic acid kinase
MTTRWIIGLACGSTIDGVDAALVETDGLGLNLTLRARHTLHVPYPRDLRELLLRIVTSNQATARHAGLAHCLLAETFATAARQVADRASFSLQKVQCLGCPGHTVWHEPEQRYPSSLALGMMPVLAERTGITTISDFRARDVAAGGQGVPLTALVDHLLFRHPREARVLLHLGGQATLVYLPAGGKAGDLLGFHAGPCNVLLDSLMRQLTGGREDFDAGGKHAVQGCCIEPLLERWLGHPFFQRRPPKSLLRQGFGEEFVAQAVQQARQNHWGLHDLLCTATHLVARSISQAIQRYLPARPTQVLLSGGGVRNGLLWHLLEQQLEGLPLTRTDQLGIPGDARKAIGFAGLAALTLDGVPTSVRSVTGAAGARLLGSITPGLPANWARCLAWMAGQTATLAAA